MVVDPGLSVWVRKGADRIELRLLDVGNVLVVSSILAQSVAFDYYKG